MSLENPDVVDLITESASGEYALIISDTGRWDGSVERLAALQAKLTTYHAFIDSGDLYEQYPEAQGRPLRIQLDTLDALDPLTQRFVDEAAQTLAAGGVRLVVEQYEPELVQQVLEARQPRRGRRWFRGRS